MKFLKRAFGGILSAVMVLSCMVPAFAATDVIKSYKSSYQYLSGESSKLGYRAETVATVSSGAYSGLPAYCLEFHKTMSTGVHLTENSTFFETLSKEGLSNDQISGVAYASIYGYPNFNYGVDDTDALYIATQWIIWEYATGYRTSADGDNPTAGLNGSFISKYASLEKEQQTALRGYLNDNSFDIRQRFWYVINKKNYTKIKTAYCGILNNIKNTTASPSFAGNQWAWGDPVTLKWSDENRRYEATVTDTNNLLNNGWSWSASCDNIDIGFSYDGNKMTIYTPKTLANAEKITLTKRLPTDAPTSVILINDAKASAQKMLVGTYPADETKRYFPIQTQTAIGNIQLTKENPDGKKLSGAIFSVYQDTNGNGTYDANTDTTYGTLSESQTGIYSLTNVPIGTYFVQETTAPDGYSLDTNMYPVTVKVNETSTVSNQDGVFVNTPATPDTGNIQVTKENPNGEKLSGATFTVFSDSNNNRKYDFNDPTYGELTETSSGIYELTDVPIGTYFVQETAAPDGYTLDSTVHTATVRAGETSIIANANNGNVFINAKIPILKVDKDGNALAGAKLVLEDDTGKTIDAWTTTTEAHEVSGLVTGKSYTLRETEAPYGYKLADDITFTAMSYKDGNVVTIGGNPSSSVTMTDEKESLIILPETGGMGNILFLLIGTCLVGAAGVILYHYRKKTM